MNYQTHERVVCGAYIRTLRRGQDMSQREMAAQIGIDRSVLSKIEAQKTNPRVKTLAAIAGVLGVPVDNLLVWQEKECA